MQDDLEIALFGGPWFIWITISCYCSQDGNLISGPLLVPFDSTTVLNPFPRIAS